MQSVFKIGEIPIPGRIALAPMDGISDQPFRFLCKKMGAGLIISEFINAKDVPNELNDYKKRTSFSEFERPFGFQLYGSDLKSITRAAKKLQDLSPDFLDFNLGCSVRRVANRGAGAGLLKNPKKIARIIHALVSDLNIPVTVKIRLGWDRSNINFREVAKIAEGEGARMICVHGRRRDQSWNDKADWEAIKIIKHEVNIPVFGNGDIKSHEDIARLFAETGCDGVMIGRAAIGNPWLFSKYRKEELFQDDIVSVIIQHWLLMLSFFGAKESNIRFRKHLKAYLNCSQFSFLDLQSILRSRSPMVDFLQIVR